MAMNWVIFGWALAIPFGIIGIGTLIKMILAGISRTEVALMVVSLIVFAFGLGLIFGG